MNKIKEFHYQGDIEHIHLVSPNTVEVSYYGWDDNIFTHHLLLGITYYIYFDLQEREIIRSKIRVDDTRNRLFEVYEEMYELKNDVLVEHRVDLRKIKF